MTIQNQNNELTNNLILVKEKFIATCKEKGYDKLKTNEHRFDMVDILIRLYLPIEFDFLSYAKIIQNLPWRRNMPNNTYYEACVDLLNKMIKYSKIIAFI